ncbi:MAG TPA: phosphatase PAP2 family protein [Candidatus Sulfotelmatobacter sp.]|nr:phosphatase PAP2 family protein [Candidatus Sulfotelmatobacter sp.]
MLQSIRANLTGRVRVTILAIDVAIACAVSIFFLDLRLEQFVVASRDQVTELAMEVIPDMGSPSALLYIVVPFAAIIFVNSDGIRANRTLFIFGAITTAHTACSLLKFLFGRARPELFLSNGTYSFDFFRWDYAFNSFPSGHAAVCAALAMAASMVDRPRRLTILTAGFAFAMEPVVTGHHFLSDALLGFSIGMASAMAFAAFLDWCRIPVEEPAA